MPNEYANETTENLTELFHKARRIRSSARRQNDADRLAKWAPIVESVNAEMIRRTGNAGWWCS